MVALALCSCAHEKQFDPAQIVGEWCLQENQVNYPQIIFKEDSTAVFRSRGDTIYFFRYFIEGESLILVNKDRYENKIEELTATSLIFDRLVENHSRQSYERCK